MNDNEYSKKSKYFLTKVLIPTLRLNRALKQESDRGCVLMAASFLDNQLLELIRSKLIGSKKHLDNIFNFTGSLGTFSSRINLAYSLGFITQPTLLSLNQIRNIRNEFGHSYTPLSFNDEIIKNRVKELKGLGKDKDRYTSSVSFITMQIYIAQLKIKKFKTINPEDNEIIKHIQTSMSGWFFQILIKEEYNDIINDFNVNNDIFDDFFERVLKDYSDKKIAP